MRRLVLLMIQGQITGFVAALRELYYEDRPVVNPEEWPLAVASVRAAALDVAQDPSRRIIRAAGLLEAAAVLLSREVGR